MRLAPHAKMDDGKIDVVIVRNASRWQMSRLFANVFDGSHVNMPCVEYYQVRSLSILSDDRDPLDIDGEIKGTTSATQELLQGTIGRVHTLETDGTERCRDHSEQIKYNSKTIRRIIYALIAAAASGGGLAGVLRLLGIM